MPLTYHFKPFPKPGEAHFTIDHKPIGSEPAAGASSSSSSSSSSSPCTCQKDQLYCKQHRETKPVRRQQPRVSLSPVEEHTDPLHRQLTPKAIRDQHRALSRVSVSAAFQSAVATEEYFPLYHSTAFARSNSDASTSSSRSRSRRRLGSASGTQSPTSRRCSSEQDQEQEQGASLPVSELTQTPVIEGGEGGNEIARRGS